MKTNENLSFFIILLCELSHAINLFVMIALLIFLPYATAQNETIPSSTLLPPPSPSKLDGFSFDPKLRINPSMAIIIVCLISAFFIMGCVTVSICHCSEQGLDALANDHATGTRQRSCRAVARGLDSIIVDTFPMFLYSDVKELKFGKGTLECAVCLNEFEDDETLRLLPKCSHVFHPDCIDAWLASHITCPVCRANLATKPVEPGDDDIEPDTHESVTEQSNSVPTEELSIQTSQTNNVSIDIHIASPEMILQSRTNRPKRPNGKLPRSHSTGHDSLVQPGEDCERYTLRLPVDVRNRLIKSELIRAKSCVAFPRIRSSTKGYRRTNSGVGYYERFDRVGRSNGRGFTINPPFVSRAVSAKEGVNGNGEEWNAKPKSLFKSVKGIKTPFERLFSGAEKDDDGERSFTKLRPNKSPV